jgi:hypothetical protein
MTKEVQENKQQGRWKGNISGKCAFPTKTIMVE